MSRNDTRAGQPTVIKPSQDGELKKLAQIHTTPCAIKKQSRGNTTSPMGLKLATPIGMSIPSGNLPLLGALVTLPEGIQLFRHFIGRRKNKPQKGVSTNAYLKPGDLRILIQSLINNYIIPSSLEGGIICLVIKEAYQGFAVVIGMVEGVASQGKSLLRFSFGMALRETSNSGEKEQNKAKKARGSEDNGDTDIEEIPRPAKRTKTEESKL